MAEKPPKIVFKKVKMLKKCRWADRPRDPIIQIEKIGQIIQVSDDTAEKIVKSGQGVSYRGELEHGEVGKLNKEEQTIADAFKLEAQTKQDLEQTEGG